MAEVGRWDTENGSNLPSVARQLLTISMKSLAPIVGWTNGMQWVVYGSFSNIRIYLGTKRFSMVAIPNELQSVEVRMWADPDMLSTVSLFIDQIVQDVNDQSERLRRGRENIEAFGDAARALQKEPFPKWSSGRSREEKEDELHQLLHDEYERKYVEVRDNFQAIMLGVLLKHARARGARYVSIGRCLFCVLEDVRTDGLMSKPVAHAIAEDLNFYAGSFESYGVKAMNMTTMVGEQGLGVWFVDTDEPVLVSALPITEASANTRAISRGRGSDEESAWLVECGCVVSKSPWG